MFSFIMLLRFIRNIIEHCRGVEVALYVDLETIEKKSKCNHFIFCGPHRQRELLFSGKEQLPLSLSHFLGE